MAINFSDTIEAVQADLNNRSSALIIVFIFLLCCWLIWLVFMPLTIVKSIQGVVVSAHDNPIAIMHENANKSYVDSHEAPRVVQQNEVENSQGNLILITDLMVVKNYLRVGQVAKLYVKNVTDPQLKGLQANIINIDPAYNKNQLEVSFAITSEIGMFSSLRPGDEISVDIFVSQVTPWHLLLHSLGEDLNPH